MNQSQNLNTFNISLKKSRVLNTNFQRIEAKNKGATSLLEHIYFYFFGAVVQITHGVVE